MLHGAKLREPAGRVEALRAAFAHLQARRFPEAAQAAAPWAGEADGALLHALALAGSGQVDAAAPALARIAAANPGRKHPVQDLLTLLPRGAGAAHVRAALRFSPDDPRLLTALGVELTETGPVQEAIDAFARVTKLQPGDAVAWSNLAKALATELRFAEAEAAFDTAIGLAPADIRIQYNHACMLLKAGRFGEGWDAFRVRHAYPSHPPPLPGPQLDHLDVAGRTILVTHDEGFGDSLQFIRYATLLAERGARVVAWMPQPLVRLMRRVPGVAEVVTGSVLPRYDAWAPLIELARVFRTDLATIPAPISYLFADAAPRPPGFAAGLVWAGNPKGILNHQRNMPVEALEPLRAIPCVRWVSLQQGVAAPGWMEDNMEAMRDFADTAALVAGLDVVVAVDTAVAHLAAGLGKRVILMDRYDNCWRWLSGREDTPWYPTLRIVRQTTPGDWAGVVRRVAAMVTRLRSG